MNKSRIYIASLLLLLSIHALGQGIPDVQITGGTTAPQLNQIVTYSVSLPSASVGSITATPGSRVSIISINQSGSITVKYTAYGSAGFQVNVVDTGGGQHYGYKSASVKPPSPTANDQSRCGTGSVTLTASGVSGASYKWYTNGGSYLYTGSSYTTPSLSQTMTYKVEAVISGAASVRVSVDAIINPFNISNMYFSGGGEYCIIDGQTGRTLQLYDINGESGYEDMHFYLYRQGTSGSISHKTIAANQISSGPLSIVFNPSSHNVVGDVNYEYSAGSYTVKVTQSGCNDQWFGNTEVIVSKAASSIEIAPNDYGDGPFNYTKCPGENVQIKTSHSDSELYVAATGNTKVSGYSKSGGIITGVISAGTYYAGRSSTAACVDNSRVAITISEYSRPAVPTLVDAELAQCTEFGVGTGVTFEVNPVAGFTYRWYAQSTGGTPLATGTTFSPQGLTAGNSPYQYYVRSYKECENKESLSTQVTAEIVEMPNIVGLRFGGGGTFCVSQGGSTLSLVDISGSAGYPSDIEFILYRESPSGDVLQSRKKLAANYNTDPTYPLVIVFNTDPDNDPGNQNYKYGAGTYKVKFTRTDCQEFLFSETQTIETLNLSSIAVVGENPNGEGKIEFTSCPGEEFEIKTDQTTAEIYTSVAGTTTAASYYKDSGTPTILRATLDAGTYYVGASGGCTDATRVEILVKEHIAPLPPSPVFTSDQNKCVAQGTTTSLSFSVNPEPGMTYVWYDQETGGSLLATGASMTTAALSASQDPYTYYVRAYKECAAKESTSKEVKGTIREIPNLILSDQQIFETNVIDLSEMAGTNLASWTGSGVTSNEFQAYYAGVGSYSLNYDYSVAGCSTSGSINVSVMDVPRLELSGYSVVKPGRSVTLSISGHSAGYAYEWFRDGIDVTSSTVNNQLSTDQPGVYQIQVSDNGYTATSNRVVLTASKAQNELNYIVTERFKTEQLNQAALPTDKDYVSTDYGYFDGLGRAIQSVNKNASESGIDVVAPIVYDAYGRKNINPLAYTNGTDGHYKSYQEEDQNSFFDNHFGGNAGDFAFTETEYERSPLNRPLKSYAPGQAWSKAGSNKPIAYGYATNSADEVLYWDIESDRLKKSGVYDPGTLYKTITTDENGKQVQEFKNLRGQTILKKVQLSATITTNDGDWLQTYYVYDDFGNLRFVLPPMGTKHYLTEGQYVPDGTILVSQDANFEDVAGPDQKVAFLPTATITINEGTVLNEGADIYGVTAATDNFILNQNFVDTWAFQYRYDGRQRMIEKRVPGAGWVYMIYDNRDRLVLTQDANQRTDNEWLFTKYDQLNRPVSTGKIIDNTRTTRALMQSHVNAFYVASVGNTDKYFEERGAAVHGYTNQSFPKEADQVNDYLTVTYYDDYAFSADTHWTLGDYSTTPQAKTLATGSKIRVDLPNGTYDWNETVTLYDSRYRVSSTISKDYQDNKDTFVNTYRNLVHARLDQTVHTHESQLTATTTTLTMDYTYDHADRLLSVTHQVNSETPVTIVENEYNELGELITKKLNKTGTGQYSQEIDYKYNIRGWLTKINDPQASDPSDYFEMQLKYDEAGQYNGNIGATSWKDPFETATNSYAYSYDPVNRITDAQYSTTATTAMDFDVTGITYDANGNIETLQRSGNHDDTANQLFDHLDYDYTGNQLTKVTDASGKDTGFKDGANSNTEYEYDANGNMIEDQNKGIDHLEYNHLNLPIKVDMQVGAGEDDRIEYIYDAAGIKLAQLVYEAGTLTKRTDYQGEFIYEDSVLQFIQHDEGRIIPNESEGTHDYQYHLKDHLGNVRATFKTTDDIDQSLATFESGQTTETDYFTGYDGMVKITADLFNHTSQTDIPGANTSIRLNGSANETEGMGKSLKVKPGDVIEMEVYAKYFLQSESAGWTNAMNTLVSNIATNVGGIVVDGGGIGQDAFPFADWTGKANPTGAPKAYMNFMVFDQNYELLYQGHKQISTAAKENGSNVAHEPLSHSLTVTEAGYVYIYLSNEQGTDTPIDVFFDDFKVTQHHTPIVSKDDYYPFGLTFNSYRRSYSTAQNYLFNSMELQPETGWLDFGPRMFMSDIGRWGVIDPLSDAQEDFSPYHFSYNSPILYKDPTGMIGENFNDQGSSGLATWVHNTETDEYLWIDDGYYFTFDVSNDEFEAIKEAGSIEDAGGEVYTRWFFRAVLEDLRGNPGKNEVDQFIQDWYVGVWADAAIGIYDGKYGEAALRIGAGKLKKLKKLARWTKKGKNATKKIPGTAKGGVKYENSNGKLPKKDKNGKPITYREYDVNPSPKHGATRGRERMVLGSDGKAYYTRDHYESFTPFKY